MFVSRLPVLFFLLTLVVAVACSSGDDSDSGDDGGQSPSATLPDAGEPAGAPEDPSPTTDPHADDDLARSVLLTVNDFPSGWSETPADDDQEENPFDECDLGEPPGRTGAAETGDFSRGGDAEVSQEVVVFETRKDAISSLDRLQAIAACVVAAINDGKLDDDEFEISDAKFGAMSFPVFGDKSDAYRLEFHVKAKDQTGLGSEGTGYIDFVRVIEGRLGFAIQASDVFSPFDTAMLESTVTKAYEKLANAEPVRSTQ